MTHRIVYLADDSSVRIIIPAPEALAQHGLMAIAIKDVPSGKPFAIVPAADIPTDRELRNAWTVDPAMLTDGIGGESNEFPAPALPYEVAP